jgi:hypothetical protein
MFPPRSLIPQKRDWTIGGGEELLRTVLIIGTVVDSLLALFLVLVFGFVMDSWHDPNGAWVGVVVTAAWLIAFVLSAAGPVVGYRLKRRGSTPGRIALAIWLPTIVLVGLTVVGFMVSPP